ncbi:toll/interleukin-1 receptor domain-containing protein [Pseudomonas sp. CCOS 191]|uniref:toll/interleukin-1 receptor domain-containing protein n=1 Tax=Pseudomonas sp. CCOS 191 TaxID=1649877 RepID=UPI0006243D18|nr:toll/interleukin-1 receptor domain-containing protein [Pseudomonas sp. CCOS 191]CRI57077.1 hypothetical protein CCOS191_2541 [Pseudomonas sp. CCOS 191]
MDATVELAKGRRFSARLFGYDVFVSFALGEPPRGNFSYASDLARRLQDAGLVVFFCEEELGYGDKLTPELERALAKSKILVVVINSEVLKEPRWIKTEVQQFRKYHPDRPVIPVSLDGCLPTIVGQNAATEDWHGFDAQKYIVEPWEEGVPNSASALTVESIVISVGRLRANRKWRALVALIMLLLITLTFVSWRMKLSADLARDEALHKQQAADMFLIAADQSNGEFMEASQRAIKNPALPGYFLNNIRQALYQRAVLLDTQGESSIRSMKLVGDGVQSSLVLGSRYDTLSILPISDKREVHECDSNRYLSNVVVSPDRSFWVGYEIGAQEGIAVMMRRWPDCKPLDTEMSRWEDMLMEGRPDTALQVLVPLPDKRLLAGWLDGVLQIYTTGAQASVPVPIQPFPLAAIWADREGRRIIILDKYHHLRLFNLDGESLAPALDLKLGTPMRVTSKPWVEFFIGLSENKPTLLEPAIPAPAIDNNAPITEPTLIVAPDPTGVVLMLQRFASRSETLLDIVAHRDNLKGCDYVYYLTETKFGRLTVQDRCIAQGAERKVEVDYPRSAAHYSAGAICPDNGIVVGDWDGNVYWMRRVVNVFDDVSVEPEHVEHSWPDAVSGVACAASDAVYVSYRSHGVKLFMSAWQLEEHEISRAPLDTTSSDLPEEDIAWNVDTFHGAGVLHLRAAQGDLELTSGTQLVWRKNFARPRAYETGSYTDAIQAVTVDVKRNRAWVLTSFGRLSLVELNTGSVLARLGTNFLSAAPTMPTGFDKLTVSEQGGVSFSYEWDDKVFEVIAKPRNE